MYHIRLHQVQIRQSPLLLWNPEETWPEVQNRAISGPTNGHMSNKNLKTKKTTFYQKISHLTVNRQCTLRLRGYPMWWQNRGTTHLECYKSRILSRICGLLGLNCHGMKRTCILKSMHELPAVTFLQWHQRIALFAHCTICKTLMI